MMLCKSKFARHNIVAKKENKLGIQMCIYQFSPDAHFPVAIKCPNGVTVLHLELFLVHFVDPPSTQNVATSAVKSWIGQMVTLK